MQRETDFYNLQRDMEKFDAEMMKLRLSGISEKEIKTL